MNEKIFRDNRPHIVFHAALINMSQYKNYILSAVKTNIGGTLNMILLSDLFSVEKFVLVSTDKAVNPVNVMELLNELLSY